MKILPALLLVLAACTLPALAQTQGEMNEEAKAEFTKADKSLNVAYQKAMTVLDEDGAAKLKTAQRAWLAYRDAECIAEAASCAGGTIYPLVYLNVKSRMTAARTEELQGLMDDPVSGEPRQPQPR